ncbi:MAG: beta-ketoacyl synthase chain length factor [Nitrospirae bacterium]|nr:beta-ketoacyl synthase chain length factor [Nitrospirota bacterium]
MNINGIGIVFTRGRGIDCFENALKDGWQRPDEIEIKGRKSFVYQVGPQTMSDKSLLKKMRRADKLSKMAVLAAADALENSGIENINKKTIGIITATAFGAHVTTFDFLNDILDYGEANVSPTTFSNSVHNAAASYISSALNIQGPTLTVTQFFFSFHSALQLAKAWLDEKRCDYVLVGAVEQYGDVLGYIYGSKLMQATDGRIKPFNFNPAYSVPSEGAVFFLVSNEDSENVFCKVEDITTRHSRESGNPAPIRTDLNIIDTDGLLIDESVYMSSFSPEIPTAAYSPIFGSMMIGSAFNCASGALMLKKQLYCANPVSDNPRVINVLDETKNSGIEFIRCIRYNCLNEQAVIQLRAK